MGAWGYGPLDSDSASDWLVPIEVRIRKTMEQAVSSSADITFLRRSTEAFAAIGLLLAIQENGGGYLDDDVFLGINVINRMLVLDEPTYLGWQNPTKRRGVLKSYQARLNKLLLRSARLRKGKRK